MHQHGHGGAQDFAEARRLYGLAAAQGHALAQVNLAIMHQHGHGGLQDFAEARRLCTVLPRELGPDTIVCCPFQSVQLGELFRKDRQLYERLTECVRVNTDHQLARTICRLW